MTSINLKILRKRSDFLRLNKGRRFAAPGLVLQSAQTPKEACAPDTARLGLTVTKKIGNAVTRNRMRRRLREAARAVLPVAGKSGRDYVLIGRMGTQARSFAELKGDIERALEAVHGANAGKAGKT